MMWVIMSAVALLVGIAMFAKVQPALPDELGFLRSIKTESVQADSTPERTVQNLSSLPGTGSTTLGWGMRIDGQNREIFHDFNEAIIGAGGQVYDKPTLYLTCYNGALFTRINTRIRVVPKNPFSFDISGVPNWIPREGQNWFSENGQALASLMASRSTVRTQIRFEETGQQAFSLNTSGLAVAAKQLAPCKL